MNIDAGIWKIETPGDSWEINVAEGEDWHQSLQLAWRQRLPLVIGELVALRKKDPRRKSGWGVAAYTFTARLLTDLDLSTFYVPSGSKRRSFILNRAHPFVQTIDLKEN